jgi:endo-1,4-beta-mannosidase
VRFSLGVNYWPRRSGLEMWRRFDAGEVREDVARIAALGLDSVRVFLLWDDFQPQPDVVEPAMLDRLEALVTAAHDAGLRTVPALCCGRLAGMDRLPAWARTGRGARDLYGGAMLDAQLVFARAAGERLRAHPGVHAWDIGHEFTRLSQPSRVRARTGDHSPSLVSEAAVAEWSRRMTRTLAEASSIGTTAGAYAGDLTEDHGIRLGSLCAPFAFASMHARGPDLAFARNRLDPEAVPFLAMLTAAFTHQPVTIAGFGHVTCRPDTFSTEYPCLGEEENAQYCTAVLARLHADGRLGASWWCWSDAAPDDAAFAAAPQEGAYGIVRADGSEKPVAAALAAFAREARTVVPADDMPAISADYYYRTLPSSTETLYHAYLAFVEGRRSGR